MCGTFACVGDFNNLTDRPLQNYPDSNDRPVMTFPDSTDKQLSADLPRLI